MSARQHPARARARQILAEIAGISYALPGNIVRRTTACGRPGCHCQDDPPVLHGPYLSWIRKDRAGTVTRRLTPDQQQRYQPWFDNARRLRDLISELTAELERVSLEAFEQAEGPGDRRKP